MMDRNKVYEMNAHEAMFIASYLMDKKILEAKSLAKNK